MTCGAGLTVTIKRTTYEMRCVKDPHDDTEMHRTPQGSEWSVRPARKVEDVDAVP